MATRSISRVLVAFYQVLVHIHSVRQLQQSPTQQCFSLTPLQHQLPTTSQPTNFFSHTTPTTSSNSSPANRVIDGSIQLLIYPVRLLSSTNVRLTGSPPLIYGLSTTHIMRAVFVENERKAKTIWNVSISSHGTAISYCCAWKVILI